MKSFTRRNSVQSLLQLVVLSLFLVFVELVSAHESLPVQHVSRVTKIDNPEDCKQLLYPAEGTDNISRPRYNAGGRVEDVVYCVVFYHMDGCPYCKDAAPIFETVSNVFSCIPTIKFISFECTRRGNDIEKTLAAQQFCRSESVITYPTIFIYSKNESGIQHSAVSKTSLYNFMRLYEFILKKTGGHEGCRSGAPTHYIRSQLGPIKGSLMKDGGQQRWLVANDTSFGSRLYDAYSGLVYLLYNWVSLPHKGLSSLRAQHLLNFLHIAASLLPGTNVRSQLVDLHAELEKYFLADNSGDVEKHLSHDEYIFVLNKYLSNLAGLPITKQAVTPIFLTSTNVVSTIWILLHLLAAGSEQPYVTDGSIKAAFIARSFRNLIDNFFKCDMCRSHFIKDFDACNFGSCTWVNDNQYGLSLWLYRMHNSVTTRVAIQQSADTILAVLQSQSGTTMLKDSATLDIRQLPFYVGSDVRFPSKDMCPKCRKAFEQSASIEMSYVDRELDSELIKRGLQDYSSSTDDPNSILDQINDFNFTEVRKFLLSHYSDESYWGSVLQWDMASSKMLSISPQQQFSTVKFQ